MFKITYHSKVLSHDLVRLSRLELEHIYNAIETKIKIRPDLYGLRLRGELKEYWKLRVGDFRIVYKIEKEIVFILVIENRKDVYKIAGKRN